MTGITALVTFAHRPDHSEAASAVHLRPAAHLDAPARVLTDAERQTWIRSHLDILAQLCNRAGLDLPTLRASAPVLALGPVSATEHTVANQPDTAASRAPHIVIAPADEVSLDPERQQALRSAILSLLRRMPTWRAPLIVDTRMDVPELLRAPAIASSTELIELSPVPRSDLPFSLRSLGEIRLAADGSQWLAPEHVGNDDSRLRVLAAQLYEATGIPVAATRLFEDEHGRLRAAHCLPANRTEDRLPWEDPATAASIIAGLAVDAYLWNTDLSRFPSRYFAVAERRAVRIAMNQPAEALGRIGRPGGRSIHASTIPDELASLLHPAKHSVTLLRALVERVSLADLGASVQRILRLDGELLRRLVTALQLDDPSVAATALATLEARRNAMGALSFLQRLGHGFYESGTSPEHIRGIVVWRLADESLGALAGRRPLFGAAPARAPSEPVTTTLRSPHEPDSAVLDAVLDLLKNRDYLQRPIARGGARLVYAIPGHGFLFKLERRAAEGLVRWRERYGKGAIPDWVVERGESYTQRLNQRYAQMVVHLGPERVYPERSFIVPECDVPGHLLSGLDHSSRDGFHRLPILGSIQRTFPYIGMPGVLEYHVPYAERQAESPFAHQYKAALERWVLLRPAAGLTGSPSADFMSIHASSTAESFLQQCVDNESLRSEARDYFTALLNRYCRATGESVDTAGDGNGWWYPDNDGQYRLAALDYLYPGDEPILIEAPVAMAKFLRGEPLTLSEKAGLLNAINFARGANFMAFQLGAPAEIDLFPDELMKAHISHRFWDLFEMLRTIRFDRREAHPDRPWGFF